MPIKGKPLLDYIIKNINNASEIDEIIIVSNAKFYDQFFEWKSNAKSKIPITLLNNDVWLNEHRKGGVRDIAFALEKGVDDDVLIILSDNYFDVDLRNVIRSFQQKRSDILAVYDVKEMDEAKKLGVVQVDGDLKVMDFFEKPPIPKSTLSATGIYVITRDSVSLLKQYAHDPNQKHEGPGFFIEWLYQRKPVYAYVIDGIKEHWYDLGSEEVYNRIK